MKSQTIQKGLTGSNLNIETYTDRNPVFGAKSSSQEEYRFHDGHVENDENDYDDSDLRSFSNLKKMLFEETNTSTNIHKCPDHPTENLEFYSCTAEKPLCTECLVSGLFVGHEVVNMKKAGERARSKFQEIFDILKQRVDEYSGLERLTDTKKEELNHTMMKFQTQIKEGFEELKQKIAAKEREILEGIDQLKIEKQWEIEIADESLKKRKEEAINLKELLENNIKSQNDLKLCSYYSDKKPILFNYLDGGNDPGQETNRILKKITLPEHFSCDRFSDTLQIINERVALLTGLEEKKQSVNKIQTNFQHRDLTLETELHPDPKFQGIKITSPLSLLGSDRKIDFPRELDVRNYYLSPQASTLNRKTNTPERLRKYESTSNLLESGFFEKYSDRIQQIRRQGNQVSQETNSVQEALTKSRQSIASLGRTSSQVSRRGTVQTNAAQAYQNLVENRKKQWQHNLNDSDRKKEDSSSNRYSILSIKEILNSKSKLSSPSQKSFSKIEISSFGSSRSKIVAPDTLTNQRSPINLLSSLQTLTRPRSGERKSKLPFEK